QEGSSVSRLQRPSYSTNLGIHLLDETSRIIYVSSGVQQGTGITQEEMINKSAHEFIMEGFDSKDYLSLYETNNLSDADMEGEDKADEAHAYAMEGNIRTAYGKAVYSRVTLFPCDNCVLYIIQMYPDAPLLERTELEVQALDGAMRRINVTREQNDETGDRQAGPLVVFVTGSISHMVDADTSDVMRTPFLKLVAPEDLLHVSKYFDRLVDSTDVLFETFSLLSRPPVVEGDVEVADHENHRVVVECLGASSPDGLAILVRKLRTAPAPMRDSMGNYIHSRIHKVDEECGYVSLAELISSDPDTSDAPEAWSRFS
ncbi:hypothetical protein IWQ56_002089, partial [Coemansia nantahalensis]